MYEAIGGEPALTRIVHRFYQGVADDPVLRSIYPQKDLTSPEKRLRLFLIQYWVDPPPTRSSVATRACACATCRSASRRPPRSTG